MAVLPLVDASVSTLKPQTVADFPRSRVFMTGVANGMSVRHIKGSFPLASYIGEENVGRTFFQDYSQAITSGVQGEFPAIYIGNLASKIGNTWAGQFEFRFKMHIRFSGLNYPSLGLRAKQQPEEPDEMENSRSWDEPTPSQKIAFKKQLVVSKAQKGR